MQEMNYEKRSAENKVLRARDQLTQLTSVEQQKKEILATRMPQGGDTIKALRWLDNNRDNFKVPHLNTLRGNLFNTYMND